MEIKVAILPIDQMRYQTVGDYYYNADGSLQFDIADTGNPVYNKMILIHELIEQTLTEARGIDTKVIDDFDMMFEKEREDGFHDLADEPGFDSRSPYQAEHALATAVELMICAHLGIKWND